MDRSQLIVLALANVPTIITVLIGILINNARLNDLNSRMGSMEGRLGGMDGRLGSMEGRITALDHKFDTRFDLLLGKVVELDNRLTRMESRRG